MSLNTLLLSDTIIKERSSVHGNLDPKLIYPDIKFAQDAYILPAVGTALYKKLQDAVNAGDWTGLADYKALMDDYIIDALMNYALSEMPLSSFQFWNKGLLRKTGQDTETPSMSELVDISNRFKNRGELYLNRLRLYLRQYAPTKFPEYLQPGNGIDIIRPDQNSFTMPVYLGDDRLDCNKLENGTNNLPYHE